MSNVIAKALATNGNTVSTGGPPGKFYGYTIRETGGSASVQVTLRDGTSGGAILADINLAAGLSTPSAWFGPQGIKVASGLIYCVIAGSGTAEGSVLVG